jgi:hypothetical protein
MYESAKVRDQTLEPRGPVVIMAFHCNRPSFLALQAKALKKFIMDDYILVVIDDAQVMSPILVLPPPFPSPFTTLYTSVRAN